MNTGKAILTVLASAAIGTTLGVLFAPDKGTATRKKILRKKDNYVEELDNKFNEFIGQINQKFERIKKDAVQMSANGRAKAKEVEDELLDAAK